MPKKLYLPIFLLLWGLNIFPLGCDYCIIISYFFQNKKDRTMCGLFVSAGTSAQFSHPRHRIAVTERGCYLSQTKQSGELFCRSDTMRQRQLPTTYSKSQVRAARTSQSPFCHSVTFPLSGESLFEAPNKKGNFDTISRLLFFVYIQHPWLPKPLIYGHF